MDELPAEPATPKPARSKIAIAAWAFYDWANSGYATTVMAGFLPVFLKDYWSPAGTAETVSTARLGMANSCASVVVALLAPVLGAIADRGGARKRFLLAFAGMGMVMTGALHFVARGQWAAALALYVIANIGFAGGNIFYDSLLVSVAEEKKYDVISSLGFALGYLGGGLVFGFNVLMVLHPDWFGLADGNEAVRRSFLIVAVWWAVFSLPLLFIVKEPKKSGAGPGGWEAVAAGFRQLGETFRHVRAIRPVLLFLMAYWLYIDGVDTIILMAVAFGKSLGFESNHLVRALLITQFIGFPSAIVFGRVGQKLGARTGIFIGLGVYVLVTFWGFFMNETWEFYALAVAVGLVQGGVQALSRSFYARLIPADKSGEFFGFYNMLGKFAAVLGPTLMGWVGLLTGSPRWSILAVLALLVGGGTILCFVRTGRVVNEE
jgi:UMF1 family MFS transporter